MKPGSHGEIQCLFPDRNSSSPLHSTSSLDSSIYLSSSHSEDSSPPEGNLHSFIGNSLHVERERIPVSGRCSSLDLIIVCVRDAWVIQLTLRLWDCSEEVCLLDSSLWSVVASKQGICLRHGATSRLLPQPIAEGQWVTVSVSAKGPCLSLFRTTQSAVSMDWSPTTVESITVNATRSVMDILAFEIRQDEVLSFQLLIPYHISLPAT